MVDAHKDIGLEWMIDTFVISGELGCTKPDPLMFRTASERLGLEPDECVFVDDNRDNLLGALSLGYHACGIARYNEPPPDGLFWVGNLDELRHDPGKPGQQKGASDKCS